MALEMARAAQTPCPLPDMSSPSMSFANRSFIVSISILRKIKKSERTERRGRPRYTVPSVYLLSPTPLGYPVQERQSEASLKRLEQYPMHRRAPSCPTPWINKERDAGSANAESRAERTDEEKVRVNDPPSAPPPGLRPLAVVPDESGGWRPSSLRNGPWTSSPIDGRSLRRRVTLPASQRAPSQPGEDFQITQRRCGDEKQRAAAKNPTQIKY